MIHDRLRSLFCVFLVLWGLSAQAKDLNLGPLVDEFQMTLTPGRRIEAAGPFFHWQEHEFKEEGGVSPVYSWVSDEDLDFFGFDLLYPLLTYDRFGSEFRAQFFQLFSIAGGVSLESGNARKRTTFFPFFFRQTSPDPEENYFAIAPFYGRIKGRLFRDEVRMFMFPLYGQSRKKDVVTDNYLYPFFHLRRGDSLKGWQIWPLVGHEMKGVTTRTDVYGEQEIIGGHDKFMLLWPVYFYQNVGIGTENPETHRVLFPLYSVTRSPDRDSSVVLWPLFTRAESRLQKFREIGAPWPFIMFRRGEERSMDRVWPFYGRRSSPGFETRFVLWPLYKGTRTEVPALDRQRTRILLFLYSDLTEKNKLAGTERRRTDLWPLFTATRDFDGNERLQLLSLLEPLLPTNRSVERNYSPLWSVWRSEKNPGARTSSQSFLWNLYRHERASDSRKCSLLFGLFQYHSDPGGRRIRLFYVPLGKARKTGPA